MLEQNHKKSIEEALRLAQSPAGQKLIQLLKNADDDTIERARTQAQQGNLEQARSTLSQIIQSPQIQELLKEMKKTK